MMKTDHTLQTMKFTSSVVIFILTSFQAMAGEWTLDSTSKNLLIHGNAKVAEGAFKKSLVLDGESALELSESSDLASGAFTVSLWFNPYDLEAGQQMLAGKNRYSKSERQWSLTIEADGRMTAHLKQEGWTTISCAQPLRAGAWHCVNLVVDMNKAELFLNGKPVGTTNLKSAIKPTRAPINLGGTWDANHVSQGFHGALDAFSVHAAALSAREISDRYQPVGQMHELPKISADLPLWDNLQTLPKSAELQTLEGVRFHVIKQKRPDTDGCTWTLGVGLAWHKGKLHASYGFNKGEENTPTEEAHVRVSGDGGKTWGKSVVIDHGEGNLGVSHGVFLSHGDRLWAFMGAFYDQFQRTHTRAYWLNETTNHWESKGVVVGDGFWPMQEPQKMSDGNWIMAGFRVPTGLGLTGNLPAVAISKGDDFTRWDLKVIPAATGLGNNLWGESTVIVDDGQILNIARYGKKARALVSYSKDSGKTWTPTAVSNLPMATSKPYAGMLSNKQRYLVCTTTADTQGARSPLTIAVSKPGQSMFSKVFLIRRSVFPEGPGVSAPNADFSYPYAVEYQGHLYVGYTHKSHAANELAVIPLSSLEIKP